MPAFITTRDRDAWATIRGYVYQVELTIERWLQLQPGQILELERGEDIDTVQKALFSDEAEQSRLLEQIKHREKNLTMRAPQALEALASFYEHLSANPELDLSYRYVTNANIGTECPSPLPGRLPAIKAWNQIRLGEMAGDKQTGALAGIRRLLNNAENPPGLNEQTWTAFARFIARATDKDLLQFIRRFEWETQKTVTGSPKLAIQRALTTKHDASPDAAQVIYERLFFHVFKLLSRPERKQVSADDLQRQLELPALSAADQQLSNNLRVLLSEIETRVAALEESFKLQQQNIQQIEVEIQSLAQQVGVNVTVDYAFRFPQLDMPPLAEPFIRRQTVTSHYIEQQRVRTWCALYGEVGRGKTYLLRMIAEASRHAIWIRLESLDGDKACLQIDGAFFALSETKPSPYRQRWYDNICSALEPGTLIVLDNLPRMTGNDLLSERCIMLAQACRSHGIKILSSSPHNLPPKLRQSLGDEVLLCEEAPSFTDQEIRDLFGAYGAPEEFLAGRGIEWLATLTERNPTLLIAAARYLAQHNWDLNTEAFDGIVRGIYAQQVNEQTQLLLKETVPDSNDRELLYRLNLVQGTFGEGDVRCVSEVAPVITHPGEKLARALGLWVQRDSDSTYRISPLLNQLGGANLESGVKRNVHLALGEAILEKHLLGPLDVFDAVSHFHSGEAFNKAGIVLLKALWAIQSDDNVADDWGISCLWYNLPLPPKMDLNIRLMLRASQIAVRHRFGKDVSYLVADLDTLLEQATDENAAWVFGATVMIGPSWVQENPIHANRYLLRALRGLPSAVLADGKRLSFSEGTAPELLIWLNGYGIKSAEELRDWLWTFEQFAPDQRRAALEGNVAEHGCFMVAAGLWLSELSKPVAERDWDVILSAYEELSERARGLGSRLLWAWSIKMRVRILGEYKDRLNVAETLAKDELALASGDPRERFLIREAIGVQFALANRLDEALPWLTGALAEQTEAYAFDRLTALLQAARAVGKVDGPRALDYIQQAVRLGKTTLGVPEIDLIRALGEHGIALWLSGDISAAFTPFQEGAERLLAFKKKDDDWKTLIVLFAHVLGYLSNLAKHGRPPQFARGCHPYDPPSRGTLLIYNPDVTAHYLEVHNSYLPASLASFAEGIGNNEDAAKWALRAFDLARESGDRDWISTLAPLAIGYLIHDDRFGEALDVARDLGVTSVAIKTIGSANKEYLRPGFDAYSVLGDKPNDKWQETEYNATMLGLVPIIFRIATVRLSDPMQAEYSAKLVAGACREIAQDASAISLWNSAAELFEQIFSEEIEPEELLTRGNEFDINSEPALRAICYIRASLDCTPRRAIQIHLMILAFLDRHLRPFISIYRQTLIPFVEVFWMKAFRESRFYFHNPREVEFRLEQALSTRDDSIIQRLLGIISTGLAMQIDEHTKSWLDQR